MIKQRSIPFASAWKATWACAVTLQQSHPISPGEHSHRDSVQVLT